MNNVISSIDQQKFLTKKEYIATATNSVGTAFRNSFPANFGSLITAKFLGFTPSNYVLLASILLALSVWDIINDIMAGNIIDKRTTRWGKFKPYIYITAIPCMVIPILQWLPLNDFNVDISQGFKMGYVIVLYLLNDLAQTFNNAAALGLASRMTPNNLERGRLQAINSIISSPLGLSATVVLIIIPWIFPNMPEPTSYFLGMSVLTIIGMPLCVYLTFVTKERIIVAKDNEVPKIKEIYLDVIKNRPLMSIMLSDLLAVGTLLIGFTYIFVARDILSGITFNIMGKTYITSTASIILIVSLICTPPTFVSLFFAPVVRRHINDRTIMIATRFFTGCCFLLTFILTLPNWGLTEKQIFYRIVIIYAIHGFTTGFYAIIPNLMTMDCLDYGEWKTGRRTEATVYAFKNLFSRITSEIVKWAGALLLVAINYSTESSEILITDATKYGLIRMFALIPAIFAFICIIPYLFYNYIGEFKVKIHKDLAIMRAKMQETKY